MKKLLILLALTGVMASCGGKTKKAEDAEQKTLAEQVYDAYKSGDQEKWGVLMDKMYRLPADEQEKEMAELQELMSTEYGPEAG